MLPRITFVVPNRGSAGGIRVTMQMGNQLIAHGAAVRIAYRSRSSVRHPVQSTKNLVKFVMGTRKVDWLGSFKGSLVPFRDPNEIDWHDGEIVIAVGSFSIGSVDQIEADVVKIRYCHGFRDDMAELTQRVWKIPMPTIAVSPMLAPRIRELSGKDPLAIIPNGISTDDYYIENAPRNAIGLIYSGNPIKDPVTAKILLNQIHLRWPEIPLVGFGAVGRPKGFPDAFEYKLNPSIDAARHIYNKSLIWLITSRLEGFCLPALEAMACGCCVISTNLTYAPNLIEDGKNGFVVPVGDVDAFMGRIEQTLESPEMQRRFVEKSQQKVKEYTWEASANKMIRFLEEFCASHPIRHHSIRGGRA